VFHRSEPIKKLELVKIKLKMLPQITGKEYGGGGYDLLSHHCNEIGKGRKRFVGAQQVLRQILMALGSKS
jgi:hypothetical protein